MTQATAATPRPSQPNAWRRFRRNQLGVLGAIIVLTLLILAIFAPQLAPYDPSEQSLLARRQPPSQEFWLGTDEFGRDIFSRLLFGTRFTLLISITSVSIGLVIGSVLGIIAGYAGGLTSGVIMRLMDLLLAFPYLLLAIIIVSALGPGVRNTIIAIGIWTVPAFARVARGAVASIRERDFVQAAKALCNQRPRIIWRHILPNTLATLLVYASLYLAYAILMESALSFLGLGVQPPTPSWAVMISSGRNYITSAPHIATIPGIAIAVAVLGFNLLGDALRDALDPRTMSR
jgi:peptide/nickel transport system permease protein